jgi:hypothetical protein
MSVDSNWYTDTVLHIAYKRGWTWRDMHEHDLQVVIPAIRACREAVAFIVDFSAAPLMPPREFAENIKLSIQHYKDLSIDVVVFTLADSSIANLLLTSHRYYNASGRTYLTAKSVDDALRQINDQRTLLHLTA